MRKVVASGIVMGLAFFSLFAGAETIIGTWMSGSINLTFRAGGTYSWQDSRALLEGRYQLTGAMLSLEYRGRSTLYTVSISGNTLQLTDAGGNVIRLTRRAGNTPAPSSLPPTGSSTPAATTPSTNTSSPDASHAVIAVKNPAAYYPSEDGSCRFPLPAGFSIRLRMVKGGPFYDGLSNRVIQRPDATYRDIYSGGTDFAVLTDLRGGAYPLRGNAQDTFTRIMTDYLKDIVMEDGRYSVVGQPQKSTWNGIPKVAMQLRSDAGLSKQVIYYLESYQEGGGPVLALSLMERQPNISLEYKGLKARPCGDIVAVGYATVMLNEESFQGKFGDVAIGMVAGLQVNDLQPNPNLQRALVGTWESANQAGTSFTGAKYTFNPDGRYTRVVYVASDAAVGHGETENGTYKVYGRILMMQDVRGQVDTRPVKVAGRVLLIGGSAYTRL